LLEEGDQIDIWVVEKALGSGGMGSVYRCHNRTAVRILAAVKVLEGSLRKFKEAEARFIREAEILFQLDHPNIVKVRNIRTDMDPPYLEMEFVEGESLEAMLAKEPLDYNLAVQFIRQMTSAVAYLHAKGVRHRDIKPANLLVKKDGNIKLVDFGLAMEADTERITQQGMTFGTVSYAPPEWITPDTLDPSHWDIYALGVVFYEMLTGKLAFPVSGQGSVRQQAMQVIIGKQNHPPLDIGSKFPDDLRHLVIAMSNSDVKARTQSAEQALALAESLETGERPSTGVTLLPPSNAAHTSEQRIAKNARPPAGNSNTWITSGGAPHRSSMPAHQRDAPTHIQVAPPKKRRMRSAMGVLVGLFVLFALVLTVGGTFLSGLWGPVDQIRPLAVTVTGLAPDSPVSIMLGNQIPNSTDGFVHTFDAAPTGDNELTWVQGEQCNLSDCPGERCPKWCFSKSMAITVEPGTGTYPLKIDLTPVPKRQVRIQTATVSAKWARSFTLGEAPGTAEGDEVIFENIGPGTYPLEAIVGRCPPKARGCWPDGTCPSGCAAYSGDLVIPWGAEPFVYALEMTDPKPGRSTATKPSGGLDKTPPPPEPSGSGAASAAVTNGRFAAWLDTHPNWHREAAIAEQRADKNYIGNWQGQVPPTPAAAATNVSWYAAAAFCKSRGGLAPVGAEPHRWSEAVEQPYVEWRVEAGKAAWRSSDGRSSDKGIVLKSSNGVTGFRCAR
jgi:serine/threonine protein kinase